MKINHEKPSEYGDFSIEPTPGTTITAVYRDAATALLIVEEKAVAGADERARSITVDPRSAQVIPLEERKHYIDYAKKSEVDAEAGLKRIYWREIRPDGSEILNERLLDAKSGREISHSEGLAFGRAVGPTLLESHKQQLQKEAAWKAEYAAKGFAERAAYWASIIFRHARWQEEWGLDPSGGIDRSWYEFALSREPEFDRMFEYILERYKDEFAYQDLSPAEIRRRVGR